MRVEVLMNGTTKIVLIPENDIEKAILDNVSKMELETAYLTHGTAILDKLVPEAFVICPKKK